MKKMMSYEQKVWRRQRAFVLLELACDELADCVCKNASKSTISYASKLMQSGALKAILDETNKEKA